MSATEDAKAKALELRRAQQRLIMAYKRAFATEDGQTVLKDLEETFRLKDRAFMPVKKGADHFAYDPLTAALVDGGRAVVIFIHERLAAKSDGDANIEPQEKIKR